MIEAVAVRVLDQLGGSIPRAGYSHGSIRSNAGLIEFLGAPIRSVFAAAWIISSDKEVAIRGFQPSLLLPGIVIKRLTDSRMVSAGRKTGNTCQVNTAGLVVHAGL